MPRNDTQISITEAEPEDWPSGLNYLGPIVCIAVSLYMAAPVLIRSRSATEFVSASIVYVIPLCIGFVASKWAMTRGSARMRWGWYFFFGWLVSLVSMVLLALSLFFRWL